MSDNYDNTSDSPNAQPKKTVDESSLNIAQTQTDHALSTIEFLTTKFTSLDLYNWMTTVLEEVYSSVLQQATATALLAAQQLAFERQQPIPKYIQSSYWEAPLLLDANLTQETGNAPDRKGLTGSARLLRDVFQLEQYAINTDQRKQNLTKTISLFQYAPAAFQQFRTNGRLFFDTTIQQFDRDFPGHYIRLIKRVRVSIIGLINPIENIKATLSTTGISRVVVKDNQQFKETTIERLPESISLTSPINTTGQFDFDLFQQNDMLQPFEGMGVASSWSFELPKPSNVSLDYDAIADILITIDYTAIHSEDYKHQVIQHLNTTFSADRAFSFRNEFPDQWYDFNNMEEVEETVYIPVEFEVLRADFPANLENIQVKELTLYFTNENGLPNMTARLGLNNIQTSFIGVSDGIVSSRHGAGPAQGAGIRTSRPVRRGRGDACDAAVQSAQADRWIDDCRFRNIGP